MSNQTSKDDIMRFLDGELTPDESERIKARIDGSTELQREVAIYSEMRKGLRELPLKSGARAASAWDRLNVRLARPTGWIFLAGGIVAWLTYSAYLFTTAPGDLFEKIAVSAVVIGGLTLLASVVFQRLRQWPTDPYKDVQR